MSPQLTLRRASHLLQTNLLTSTSLSLYCHSRALLGESPPYSLNAFAHIFSKEDVLTQAARSDDRLARNRPLSPLDGIPISVKANIAVADAPLTAGSRMLSNDNVVGYDADVVRSLRRAGAVIVGITTMDEFGMGSLGTNVVVNPSNATTTVTTRNPQSFRREEEEEESSDRRLTDDQLVALVTSPPPLPPPPPPPPTDTHHSCGGSSSGSAASVAFRSSLASLGTDTGGSIRLPAAWTTLCGFKPSYGSLSRYGVVEYASSLDTVGVLAGCVGSVDLVWRELTKEEGGKGGRRDATRRRRRETETDDKDDRELLRVGIPSAFHVEECPADVRRAWEDAIATLRREGIDVQILDDAIISPLLIKKSLAAYYVLACAEAASNLSRYDGIRYGGCDDDAAAAVDDGASSFVDRARRQRTVGFGREVIRRVLCGTAVLSSDRFHTYYESAAALRGRLTRQLERALEEKDSACDVMLIPTVLRSMPPVIGGSECNKEKEEDDGTASMMNDIMTVPISLAGLPAVSVPFGKRGVGLQVFGRRWGERDVLRVAETLQHCG